ncbi:MAG TPA: serine/threonine-protein kinase [Myxococcales bacterium]|nr:serine/threonine-protein kinase [Myxococcales bacterium]
MSELRQGDRIGGRYVLIDRLGVGGMGEVWLAELEGAGAFRRRVVIKLLAPERRGDARLASMLADEARLVGLLHHPGIISAIDYLESENEGPIFVLEFVDGCSLRSALRIARRRNDPMPEALAAHIGAQVARALHAAHNACDREGHPLHLVHRDISPENVLLSRGGAVYLGDFGVARARGCEDVTDPGGGPKGKLGYMAPEQASCGPVGPQADIFSLGRVVAEAADLRAGHALRKVLEKATAMDPRHRFQTASELATAFVRACPTPNDPDGALSAWLHRAAAEALQHRRMPEGAGPAVRVDPPPAGIPIAATSGRLSRRDPLFAKVAAPRRRALKIIAALGVLIALSLPAAWIVDAARSAQASRRAAGISAPAGELRVFSQPVGAEVYVDGALRGVTPLNLELGPGQHTVRVGSARLGKWRSADVKMFSGSSGQLDFDLN